MEEVRVATSPQVPATVCQDCCGPREPCLLGTQHAYLSFLLSQCFGTRTPVAKLDHLILSSDAEVIWVSFQKIPESQRGGWSHHVHRDEGTSDQKPFVAYFMVSHHRNRWPEYWVLLEFISKAGGASEKQKEATRLLLPQSHAIGTISILSAACVTSRPQWLSVLKFLPHPVPRHNTALAK